MHRASSQVVKSSMIWLSSSVIDLEGVRAGGEEGMVGFAVGILGLGL